MRDIAHTAIDAGADIVIGHGPHHSLAVEAYKGKPIYYGLGSFSFHTGHGGHKHGNWIGMMAEVEATASGVARAGFRFVRHNDANETMLCDLADEQAELRDIEARSAAFDTRLTGDGQSVDIALGGPTPVV